MVWVLTCLQVLHRFFLSPSLPQFEEVGGMPLLNICRQALIFSLYGAILAVNHILSIWYKIPDSDLGSDQI